MIRVFHGSNIVVREPLVGIGRENLDFGLGFYVTALTTQAEEWARNKARYYMQPEGTVSQYDFDFEGGVANDRVIDTVENYRAGLIDEDTALRLLSLHQPNHQICITRQEEVDRFLRFTDSYQVEAYVE